MKIEISNNNINEIKRLSQELNINSDCANLLLNRGLTEEDMYVVSNDNYYDLLPNDNIKNIPEAAKVIAKYLQNNDAAIYIYGDYDNDGIQSTFITYDCFTVLADLLESTCQIEYHIPERKEGYGLSAEWCYDIVHNDIDNENILVVTVDNGITKKYEVAYLKNNGIETIVTDHHCPQEGMVPDCIVVDEFLDKDNEYMGLCGAGVAFKLCSYLLVDYYKDDTRYNESYLPNVMTATISDMVPVSLENSIFIRNGLQLLNDKDCECSDAFEHYMNFRGYKPLIPKDIAFDYGPLINACGRMGEANTAIEFLLQDTDLTDIYNKLVLLNDKRKDKTKDLIIEAIPQIKTSDLANVVISNDAGGCAGLLANKLMEMYNRPTIVFSEHKDTYSGSARSIEGLDLQSIFKYLQDKNIVISYGGHEAACGVEISKENLETFKEEMNRIIYKIIMDSKENKNNIEPTYYADKQLSVKDISYKTINNYKDIMFYNDLTAPKFYLENVTIDNVSPSKNNSNNLKFKFKDNTGTAEAWCWGYGDTYEGLGSPKKVNMLCSLERFNNFLVIQIDKMEAA
jgi:single-stranded-DNA-specific exonuclease